MKRFSFLAIILGTIFFAFIIVGCEEDTTTEPVDPEVTAPTNLRAASADKAILLEWTLSVDESKSNFNGYILIVKDENNVQIHTMPISKGISAARIDGLTNGKRYTFTIYSVTTKGKASLGSAEVEWAPAVRQSVDDQGLPIKVYATTSKTYNSAVDLYNDLGKAEVIPQSGAEFRDRGDLYVYTPDASTSWLSIVSPKEANNQGLETQFSSEPGADADNLDDHLISQAPLPSSYTEKEIQIYDASYSKGKVYFGRLVRGNDYYYFRMLVKRGSGGSLIQGAGDDRYFEMVVSFQNAANVPFAKK